jgi:hypothetical protein
MRFVLPPDAVDHGLDALERRTLLDSASAAMPFALYYPEGFVHDRISEFVPITNPNGAPAAYRLIARYETGVRDQVIEEGWIPARTRGGVTLNVADRPDLRRVRPDEAYALVLESSLPLDATISHYDFGATIGQSFTGQPSTTWSFTNVQKDPATVRDFLVYYNTTTTTAHLTITFIPDAGDAIVLHQVLGGLRRGGLNINDTDAIPVGTFGVTIESDQPIVAALTHYDVSLRRGFGVLGAENGGDVAGIIPVLDFQDNDRGHGNNPDGFDDDNPGHDRHGRRPDHPSRPPAVTLLNVLNATDADASVTFTFIAHEGFPDLSDAVRTVTIPAKSRMAVGFLDLTFDLDENVGVRYESDQVVTVAALIVGPRRTAAIPAITKAATDWGFGEGFMTRERAGLSISEHLFIYNPAAAALDITVQFHFVDGTTVSLFRSVAPGQIADINLDRLQVLLNHVDDRFFFGMRVTGDAPFVATLDHLDRILSGGFTTAGQPLGDVVPLSAVLPPAPQPA